MHATTAVNNLYLKEPVFIGNEVAIVPLGLTTTELPRLPTGSRVLIEDYLGPSLLKLKVRASSALLRPHSSEWRNIGRLQPVDGLDFDTACESLTLQANRHVSEDADERRRIFVTLRDAYDAASGVVHDGKVPSTTRDSLSEAQDLCRKGILKLLHEGRPKDWIDPVLGA